MLIVVGAVLLAVGPVCVRAAVADRKITVFAAASLKNALDAVSALYERKTGDKVLVAYAASSALAKQILAGAPADVFVSADSDWMDYLETHQALMPATRRALLGNSLVLVAPADSTITLMLGPSAALAEALGDGRLAVGETSAVPAGRYAKAALTRLGLWRSVKDKLAETENVRVALSLVARGEAPLGIVYGSDAVSEPGVRVIATFPENSHPAIVYPVAVTAASTSQSARAYQAFLSAPEPQRIFQEFGFSVLGCGEGCEPVK